MLFFNKKLKNVQNLKSYVSFLHPLKELAIWCYSKDFGRFYFWKEIPSLFLLQESKLRLLVKETKNLTQQKIFCSFTSLLLQKLAKCFVPSFVFLSEGSFCLVLPLKIVSFSMLHVQVPKEVTLVRSNFWNLSNWSSTIYNNHLGSSWLLKSF